MMIPSTRGTKKQTDSDHVSDPRLVQTQRTTSTSARPQWHCQSWSHTSSQTISSRLQRRDPSSKEQHTTQSNSSSSSSSIQSSILRFFHLASGVRRDGSKDHYKLIPFVSQIFCVNLSLGSSLHLKS